MAIKDTLKEREATHGAFKDHAEIAQQLKHVCRAHWQDLSYRQQEALEMICHKIARILAGDQNHVDHWHDIIGYATLIEDYLNDQLVKTPFQD